MINKIKIMILHGKTDKSFNISDPFVLDLDSWDVTGDSPPRKPAQWVKVEAVATSPVDVYRHHKTTLQFSTIDSPISQESQSENNRSNALLGLSCTRRAVERILQISSLCHARVQSVSYSFSP